MHPARRALLDVSGHADEFVAFLADECLPFLERTYSTHGAKARALIGKSFGGSGVAHAMIDPKCSRLFSEFLLGSPSIAWDDGSFFRLEEEARARAAASGDIGSPPYNAAVYCCVGGEEKSESVLRLKEVLDSRPQTEAGAGIFR